MTDKSISLKFTGKMVILVDMEGYDPLEFTINDMDVVTEVMHVLLGKSGNIDNVQSYSEEEGKKLKTMVEGKND